jgi:hypothetical protein
MIQPTPGVDARVFVLGAPARVTADVSGPIDVSDEVAGPAARDAVLVGIAFLVVAALLAATLAVRRRRGARTARDSPRR